MAEHLYDPRPGLQRQVITELHRSELDAPSGIFDESGGELNNEQAMRFILESLGYQVVHCNMNGDLSAGANRDNSQATAEKKVNPGYRADYWYAVTALPPMPTSTD